MLELRQSHSGQFPKLHAPDLLTHWRAGVLLGRSGAGDVIDAAVVLLAAADLDEILTSDPQDIAALVAASGTHADVIPV